MLILSILAFFVVIFLLASITVTVAWMAFLKTTAEESDAARRDREAVENEASSLFRPDRFSTLNFWDSLLERFDFVNILEARLAQAELDSSVGRVTLAMLFGGTITMLILWNFVPGWAAILGGVLAALAPYGYILRKRDKRFQKFRENFPDVLDSLSRALRAGYPLSAAVEMISTETLPPVSVEMRKTSAEANLGMGWPRALENLAARVPLLEVNLFIAAVQLHARTGGKLSEVLSGLAENMREAIALQGEVRALAAHGKLTGVILTALPIVISGMMLYFSPGYLQILFHYPYGKTLIAAAVACLVLAHFVIRKIVDIKV
ncbi:MAG TPA: type II secretion system F family protein [Bryobacteraceae bacterium]|jgi:tight adherence protein B|nr:type II secretion system F family protein [Bryobacteraceae bacterium]